MSDSSAADIEPDGTDAPTNDDSRITDAALPRNATLSVSATANRREAAAIAAAVGAHLRDRAAAAETAADDGPTECNRWKLCGRLGVRNPPRRVAHGEEWKAAGRSWRERR